MKPRRTRKSAKRGSQAKPKIPHWRLIPFALLLLAAVIYLFYYLDHLPQAKPIRSGEEWHSDPGEQLRLLGMPAGPAIFANLREAGSAKLSFAPGTMLLPDQVQGRPRPITGPGFEFTLHNADRENVSVDIRLDPSSSLARSTLNFETERLDSRFIQLTLTSDTPIRVEAAVIPNPSASEHGQIQWEDQVLHNASLSVPPRTPFTIGLPADHLDALLIETGELAGVEIGSDADGDFQRRSIACGAERGRIIWRRLVPNIRTTDCGPGRLTIEQLRVHEGVEVTLKGTGFATRDGTTDYWPGFKDFRQNDVVKALFSALLVALVGWVILIVRRKTAK